jgi:circadian clock protein KaiC
MNENRQSPDPLVPTGIEGLDNALHGGLPANRLYLVEGAPGSGKTTLALQFLMHGVASGERCLLVTLSETKEELLSAAASHGWSLDGIDVLELIASEASLTPDSRLTMYHPSEVELSETTKSLLEEAARLRPARLVLDSLSEFRLLAENSLRYRRQILALKHFFARQKTTVLFVDDRTSERSDMALHSLAHGVISLEREISEYGTVRRRVFISKMRGSVSAKDSTTSSFAGTASRSSRDWSPPSTGLRTSEERSRAVSRRSTRCWAAGLPRDPAR